MAGVLFVTGPQIDGDGGLNFITWLAVRVVKICRMVQTGSAYAADATMHCMLGESQDTEPSTKDTSSQPKRKKTGRWTNPNSPPCEDSRRSPTVDARYPLRS